MTDRDPAATSAPSRDTVAQQPATGGRRTIPIRIVSRAAIEGLVRSFNRAVVHADGK